MSELPHSWWKPPTDRQVCGKNTHATSNSNPTLLCLKRLHSWGLNGPTCNFPFHLSLFLLSPQNSEPALTFHLSSPSSFLDSLLVEKNLDYRALPICGQTEDVTFLVFLLTSASSTLAACSLHASNGFWQLKSQVLEVSRISCKWVAGSFLHVFFIFIILMLLPRYKGNVCATSTPDRIMADRVQLVETALKAQDFLFFLPCRGMITLADLK